MDQESMRALDEAGAGDFVGLCYRGDNDTFPCEFGVVFCGRSDGHVSLDIDGRLVKVSENDILEFSIVRRAGVKHGS